MSEFCEEIKFAKQMTIAVSAALFFALLVAVTVITAMVSVNFNILRWLE